MSVKNAKWSTTLWLSDALVVALV